MWASSAHMSLLDYGCKKLSAWFRTWIYEEGWRAVLEMPNLDDKDFTLLNKEKTNPACLTLINMKWSKSWLTPQPIYINSLTIFVNTYPFSVCFMLCQSSECTGCVRALSFCWQWKSAWTLESQEFTCSSDQTALPSPLPVLPFPRQPLSAPFLDGGWGEHGSVPIVWNWLLMPHPRLCGRIEVFPAARKLTMVGSGTQDTVRKK